LSHSSCNGPDRIIVRASPHDAAKGNDRGRHHDRTGAAAVNAGLKKSLELKLKMNVAIVDAGGNLKAFARMDGAWIGSIDISQKKARTARFFDMPTGEIGKLSQPGKPLYQIEVSNGGLISFPGGVPVTNSAGEVIGAVGVSGSTVDNDHRVAEAAAGAVKA